MSLKLPEQVWRGREFTCIHAAVLFADIQNSVLISSALSLADYDRLIDEFQTVMMALCDILREQGMPVGEVQVVGDQMSVFFYNPAEVQRNWELDGLRPVSGARRERTIKECGESNCQLVYNALKAAIQFKNMWLAERFNIERVYHHHSPFEVSIGIHYGRVFLRDRPDGQRRIEGYNVSLGKRVQSTSQFGRYSLIMFGQDACETLRSMVVAHTQLRQRVFFHHHEVPMLDLKGVTKLLPIYELKFCHRIKVPLSEEAVRQHEEIFAVDPTRIWSYYQLVEHYGYDIGDWERAYYLASRAQVMNPQDEKIKLDLSAYHFQRGELHMAEIYCRQALQINPDFDLAYERLAMIANDRDDLPSLVECMRQAVSLSPGSAGNHRNLGLALANLKLYEEALEHLNRAVQLYPQYAANNDLRKAVDEARRHASIPSQLDKHLRAARRRRQAAKKAAPADQQAQGKQQGN